MKILTAIVLLLATPARAQIGPDARIRAALAWDAHQHAADVVSTIVVGVALARPCLFSDRSWRCVRQQSVQVGIGIAAAEITKHLVPRTRPNGVDQKSFFSEHTMLACVGTIRSNTWELCPTVGYLRVASDWHWSTDVGAGAAVGLAVSFIAF